MLLKLRDSGSIPYVVSRSMQVFAQGSWVLGLGEVQSIRRCIGARSESSIKNVVVRHRARDE